MNDAAEMTEVIRAREAGQQLAPAIQIVEIHEEPTFREVVVKLIRGWWIALLTLIAVLALVSVWISIQPIRYEAKMVIAPASQAADASGAMSGLSGLAQLAGISVGGTSAPPMFERYIELLTSVRVAERAIAKDPDLLRDVFASQWDEQTQQWHPPPAGMVGGFLQWLKAAFGLPTWAPPGPASLAGFLGRNLEAEPVEATRLYAIGFRDSDPAFALRLLKIVADEAEAVLRQEFREQTEARLGYLQQQLATAANVDIRKALAASTLMFLQQQIHANANLPVAADIVEQPYVDSLPVEPQVVLILALATFGGLILGVAMVFVLDALRIPRPHQVRTAPDGR